MLHEKLEEFLISFVCSDFLVLFNLESHSLKPGRNLKDSVLKCSSCVRSWRLPRSGEWGWHEYPAHPTVLLQGHVRARPLTVISSPGSLLGWPVCYCSVILFSFMAGMGLSLLLKMKTVVRPRCLCKTIRRWRRESCLISSVLAQLPL